MRMTDVQKWLRCDARRYGRRVRRSLAALDRNLRAARAAMYEGDRLFQERLAQIEADYAARCARLAWRAAVASQEVPRV
jgi:hypothetical protein